MQSTSAHSQRFDASYTPCNPLSCFHSLRCGHRIEACYNNEHCGINCKHPKPGSPFICPDCLVADVRLEMELEGLIISEEAVQTNCHNDKQIQHIANAELKTLLQQGHRTCKLAPQFKDPKLQFWHKFLVEEGYEGIEADKDVVLHTETRYKRPQRGLRPQSKDRHAPAQSQALDACIPFEAGTQQNPFNVYRGDAQQVPFTTANVMQDWHNGPQRFESTEMAATQASGLNECSIEDLVYQFCEPQVGLEVEDEATKAVREAFELCGLVGEN